MNQLSRSGSPDEYKILIIDQHPLIHRGLKELLRKESAFEVSHCCAQDYEAFEAILLLVPDLVIVDPVSSDGDGLAFIKAIRKRFPNLAILILTTYGTKLYVELAFEAGATAYTIKQEMEETVLEATYSALQGNRYISPHLQQTLKNTV